MAPSAPGPEVASTSVTSHSTSSFRSAVADPIASISRTTSRSTFRQPQPVRRSSSIQDILENGRRRSEILSASNSQTNIANQPQPLRRQSTIKIAPEQAEYLREHEEFLEWKKQKAQRERERKDMEEDSADERSAITKHADDHSDYGTNRASSAPERRDLRSRPSQRSQQSAQAPRQGGNEPSSSTNTEQQNYSREDGFWKRLLAQFGSLELENKGSVARDHLALERTFLAWLRTSLAFASIGIAVTQLFRLNTSLAKDDPSNSDGDPSTGTHLHFRSLGKPIGSTFIGISIVVLFIGYHRYFESQHWIIRGKFPASRGSIALISLIALLLMVASFVLILVVEPRSFEK